MNSLLKLILVVALGYGISTVFFKSHTAPSINSEIINVYGTTWCPQTKKLRQRLEDKGIPYAFHNVEEQDVFTKLKPRLADKSLQKNGRYLTPIVEDYNGNLKATAKVDDYYQQALQRGIIR